AWQFSRAKYITAQGQPSWLAVYTTRADTQLEAVMFIAATEDLFKAHRFAVERMIVSIEFPGVKPLGGGGGTWVAGVVPDKAKDVKIVGAWLVARTEMDMSVDPKARGLRQLQTLKIVALFENGVAAKVDARNTMLIDTTYPAEGLATMNVADAADVGKGRRFGKWSEEGGKIKITWNFGNPDTLERVKDDLKGDGILWSALKPIDGTLLAGTYVRKSDFGLPWTLTLRKDGSFDADLLNDSMGGKLVNPKFPEMGSGTYEFRKLSLILRFDTGYTQAIHARFDADDPAAAKNLFLNGYTLERTNAPAAAAGIAPPAVAGDAVIHGLVIPVPADWKRNDADGVVYLTPPQIPGVVQYLLAVFPPGKLKGGHWESHKAMVKALLEQAKWAGEPVLTHRPDGPGLFIKTEAAGRSADGQGRTFTLFSAVHDETMEAILGVNNIDRNVVDPVLQATHFKKPPVIDPMPQIVEAYRRLNQRLSPTADGMVAGSLLYDRIWLRSDGVADFSTCYVEGYAASMLPMKTDASLLSGDYGSWTEVDGKIHIIRSAGAAPEVYERVGDGLRGGGKEWEPMPRVDGLKLSGRWEMKSPPQQKVSPFHDWIEFTPEGRFKVEGVLKSVATGDVSAVRPPAKGAGRYEIRNWTIFFTFDDGTAWSTDFSTLGRDGKPDASILFRTTAYPKAK
ncbi:MAG TPA: hypothetical protein VNM14_06630, partial [Planctomycetota bacterium]|nr:hypothetical protein [Planctomycetota bacterium]